MEKKLMYFEIQAMESKEINLIPCEFQYAPKVFKLFFAFLMKKSLHSHPRVAVYLVIFKDVRI